MTPRLDDLAFQRAHEEAVKRLAFAPKGRKRQYEAELKDMVTKQLQREVRRLKPKRRARKANRRQA